MQIFRTNFVLMNLDEHFVLVEQCACAAQKESNVQAYLYAVD